MRVGLLTRRGAVLATVLALCAGVPAAASADPGPVAPAAAAPQVTVMTWNVWGAEDGVPSGWRKVLRNQRADIISLQEICRNQAITLQRQLRWEDHLDYMLIWRETNWHPFACAGGYQGQAILTRKAKVSVVAGSVERYKYKSSDSQKRGYVALTADIAGQKVRVLNTHPWNDTPAWEKPTSNINELVDLSKSWPGRQILTGDFNAVPKMMKPLYREGFRDAADPAPDPWAHPGRPTYKNMKLDYILYRGGPETVGRTKVLYSPSSDHRLVLATFRLSGNP
ncbi:endonuclease/exonuclease/phosphatase family protein [Streptomyces bluensis]|uniref:endonuclease/exonuclease/phosphatase family protein n=1 Tax=Streptomyces bluensis TaxID=33897 RepID=UPI001677916A|nr:endonuclease/exonuclease/phosphatase family protein [Streptomyces bluensis]GGZ42946.1 endonuclease [Streptomyces bluensis]